MGALIARRRAGTLAAMVAVRGRKGRLLGGAGLVWAAVVTGAIGCGSSSARHGTDAGDGGMGTRDAARALDGPTESRPADDAGPHPDAARHDAGAGLTIRPGWNALEASITPRSGHTATLLPNGQVLIAGGQDLTSDSKQQTLATAEVHDVDTGAVTATAPMMAVRYNHTAILLSNGKVLIVGGADNSNVATASAELYDPATATFTLTGSLNAARQLHTATLLPSGKVLIAGGRGSTGDPVTAAELYDPATGTFMSSGSMLSPRYEHTATLLPNGKVLIAAGYKFGTAPAMITSELYDPATGMFSATGSLSVARYNHTATLLPNGKVLVAGGQGNLTSTGAYVDYASAELYDPATGIFSATGSLSTPRLTHAATLLSDGTVLVTGGYNHMNGDTYLASVEVYDPVQGTFSAAAPLIDVRFGHTATALQDGRVFLAGGTALTTVVEIYDPGPRAFAARGLCRIGHTATLLADGRVLFPGGRSSWYFGNSALFDPAHLDFVPTAGQPKAVRDSGTATLLADGRVFLIGGLDNDNVPKIPAEIYSPATDSFTSGALPITQRIWHTATLLPNGRVLIAGGGSCTVSSSTEIFDPSAGTFTASGSMMSPRGQHTATLLANGKVLIAGGMSNASSLGTAELFDPATGAFAPTGMMTSSRFGHTATLLPDGRVLIIGGWSGTFISCNATPGSYQGQAVPGVELYDPATGSFTAVGPLNHASYDHAAALRPDGTVLVVGGIDLVQPPSWDAVPDSALDRAEIYEPSTKTFSPAGTMRFPRYAPTATTLSTGDVLIVGGNAGASGPSGNFRLGLAEIYH